MGMRLEGMDVQVWGGFSVCDHFVCDSVKLLCACG